MALTMHMSTLLLGMKSSPQSTQETDQHVELQVVKSEAGVSGIPDPVGTCSLSGPKDVQP